MPYPKDLCFATFARILKGYYTYQPKDPALVESLMGYITNQEQVLNIYGNPITFDGKSASLILNRQKNINDDIRAAALDEKIADGAKQYFEEKIIPEINEYLEMDMIFEMKSLVLEAPNIGDDRKRELLKNADRDHIAEFLANVYIYCLCIPNKILEENTAGSTGIQASVSPESLLSPDIALHKIVNTVLLTLSSAGSYENFEFQAFKNTQIGATVQKLVDSGRMSLVDMYHSKNFVEIAEKADRIFKDAQTQTDHHNFNWQKFDFDWFLRFFDAAGKIKNEDMQNLWARVLAGEIKNQGKFSLRTLETLRNLRSHEAEVFQKACHCVLYNIENSAGFIFYDDLVDEYNIDGALNNTELRMLEDAGLIWGIRRPGMKKMVFLDGHLFYSGNACLQIKELDAESHPFEFNYYPLTEAAMQLADIVKRSEITAQKYMFHLGYVLKKEYGAMLDVKVTWFDMNKTGSYASPEVGREDFLAKYMSDPNTKWPEKGKLSFVSEERSGTRVKRTYKY